MTDEDATTLLSWPECARLCKSDVPQPHTSLAFVWGQNDHVLRRFFQTRALPHLRRLRVERPTWQRGPGELFLGLAARGRPLQEMLVTTSVDLAGTRRVRFWVQFNEHGEPFTEYTCPSEPLLEGELDHAVDGLGLPRPVVPRSTQRE